MLQHVLLIVKREKIVLGAKSEEYWLPISIRQFPLHFSSRASLCAVTFKLHSTTHKFWYFADRASQYIYLNINELDAL